VRQLEEEPVPHARLLAAAAAAALALPATGHAAPADLGDLGDGNAALAPIRHQSLTLVPIVTTIAGPHEDYLTLDEGMERRLIRVGEIADGDVNALELRNRSDRPLFVMAGEVVLGGKQDRIIGKNTVIPPRTTQSVPVFCVEHGRWSGRRAGFRAAGALAHTKLRTKASFEDQGQVWTEVKEKNGKRRTDNATDTYRQVAAQQSSGSLASWERALDRGLAGLAAGERARLVGYAVALNGRVVAVDVFGSPALFARLDRKLRRSYITEAIDEPIETGTVVPSPVDIRAFVARAEAEPAQKVYESTEADTLNAVGSGEASTRVMKKGARPDARPIFKSAHKR
jgi:hypothetical protein